LKRAKNANTNRKLQAKHTAESISKCDEKKAERVAEAEDLLMGVTQMLEEDDCNPFRPKKV
jgi:hypothetical protein